MSDGNEGKSEGSPKGGGRSNGGGKRYGGKKAGSWRSDSGKRPDGGKRRGGKKRSGGGKRSGEGERDGERSNEGGDRPKGGANEPSRRGPRSGEQPSGGQRSGGAKDSKGKRGGKPSAGRGRGGPNPGGRAPEARSLAGNIVRGVLAGRGAARTHVERALERQSLGSDEPLLTELVYGTLRHVGTLDHLLESCATKGLRKVEESVLNHLRVAAYQLVFLERTAPAVAVDAAVRSAGGRRDHVRGFVNGLLRGLERTVVARHEDDAPPPKVPRTCRLPGRDGGWVQLSRPLLPEADAAWLACAASLPPALAASWIEAHGFEGALELARASNAPPPLALRVNVLQAKRDEVLAELEGKEIVARAGEGPYAIQLKGGLGEVGSTLLWSGRASVQDETAQHVAPFVQPQPGERVVDLCAAPGGKATHLLELMGDEGRLDALDIDADRLARVESAAKRLRLTNLVATLVDPEDPRPPEGAPIDRVLADVPCSNTGVLRRRVEVRWRLDGLDWPPLLILQARLLDRALEVVRPGGVVVYSTCSIDERENQGQVRAALARHSGLELEAELVRVPTRQGGDGGYAARLRKPE